MASSYSDGLAVSLATGMPEVGHRQRIVVGPEGPSNPQSPRPVAGHGRTRLQSQSGPRTLVCAALHACSFASESRVVGAREGGDQVVSTGRNGGS
jgi:hypothetical protein